MNWDMPVLVGSLTAIVLSLVWSRPTTVGPVLFAWAGAAAYCEHETTSTGAAHFGHHAHVHAGDANGERSKNPGVPFVADADCGACHASSATMIANLAGTPALAARCAHGLTPPLAPIASALSRAPDRPQWLRFA